jgi:mannose-6-phosphate isomerase
VPTVTDPRAIVLPPNPVWRSYVGGAVLRKFRGSPGTEDDHFPEDWLASTVRARNGVNSQGSDEGLSRVGNVRGELLAESIERDPSFWRGAQTRSGVGKAVLWKLLDAAARLQLQAHPDAEFARCHLNSSAGKTECWYILTTRGDAHVHLGFQRSVGRAAWARMIREQRVEEMLACFDKIPVRPGDCFVVPAGTPHAIGAGIFMMELQEPTDWVVRCETRTTDGKPLPPEACFMGLDLERCLDVFNYEPLSVEEVRHRWQQRPRVIRHGTKFVEEEIISPAHHEFFRLHRLHGTGAASWSGGEFTLLVALRGGGVLATGKNQHAVRAGETWLLPGSAMNWDWHHDGGDWEILLAKPPRQDTIAGIHKP